jgi:hypothetical protein
MTEKMRLAENHNDHGIRRIVAVFASDKPLLGVDCMISKPIFLMDLRRAVAKVLPGS